MQVWLYDENKVFTESIFVEELKENMTKVPLLVGHIKPTFNGEEWFEGATEEEIKVWQEENEPQEPQKTLEEQLEESNKRVVFVEAAMAELAKQVAQNTLLK